MSFLSRGTDFKKLFVLWRFYSSKTKNYYDILKVRKNCSDKEIKEAFIQMTKEYHPDKNKDVKAQEHFVNIVEAYNVLSKPGSRAKYDTLVDVENTYSSPDYHWKPHVPYNLRKNPNYSYYYDNPNTSNKTKTEESKRNTSYYGIRGIKRLPNYVIVMMCFGFAMCGLVIQMFVIKKSFHIQQRRADEHTRQLAIELDKVRATALGNGNELQTQIMMEKIVIAANPTVATASLGQALAKEKKNSKQMIAELKTENDIDEDVSGNE